MTLEPIFNPILVAVGYGEIPGKWAIIGGLVVILSVTVRGVWPFLRKTNPYSPK